MRNVQLVIARGSEWDENTVAIIEAEFDTNNPAPFETILRNASQTWVQTAEGREATDNGSNDYNIGDLANEDTSVNSDLGKVLAVNETFTIKLVTNIIHPFSGDDHTRDKAL